MWRAYGRGMRLAARLRIWPPTVMPIWASSPAAWTAVVTISVPLGRPSVRRGGGGGGGVVGRCAAAALACAAAAWDCSAFFGDRLTADLTACGFARFTADAFAAAGLADAFAVAGFADALAAAGFVAAGFADALAAAGFDLLGADFAAAGELVAAAPREAAAPARRSPPSLVGRVARRLPSTLGSLAFAAFLLFFFAVFWLMASAAEREFPVLALRRGTVSGRVGRRRL
jgi:hypothetical protein